MFGKVDAEAQLGLAGRTAAPGSARPGGCWPGAGAWCSPSAWPGRGAHGHAAHGLTRDHAEDLARQLADAGFGQVRLHTAKAGHRPLVIIRGAKDHEA